MCVCVWDMKVQVDFVKEYWHEVFSPFLEAYADGFTPNPDLFCNKEIKFKAFYQYIREQGFDAMATGHYCRVGRLGEDRPHEVQLLRGVDPNKDQSYFLALIEHEALQHTIFPLGDLHKRQVRELAHQCAIPVADRRESMGICFIGKRNFRSFLHQYVPPRPGHFVDVDSGRALGPHQGWHTYTVGQRALIGGMPQRLYVCSKDAASGNVMVCSHREHPALLADTLRLHKQATHWISPLGAPPAGDETPLQVQIRHLGEAYPCVLKPHSQDPDLLLVRLVSGSRAWGAACGQGAVLYAGEVCLGGGVIVGVGDE